MRMASASAAFFVLGLSAASAANFQAANDRVYTLQIKNSTNTLPWPQGTGLVATSSLPNSLGVAISGTNASGFALTLTPKVQVSPGIIVSLTGNGATGTSLTVDIIPDPIPPLILQVDQTPANVTNILQPVPTAPGP